VVFGIEILEQPINVLVQSDKWQIAIAITSIIIAGTAIIGLLKSNHTIKIQLQLSRAEFRHRTRPILARHVHKKKLDNVSEQEDGDTYSITPPKILFHFINNGIMNATNVRKKSFVDTADFYQSKYFDPEHEENSIPIPDLAPTEYYSVDVEWTAYHYDLAIRDKHCYFALIIWYDDDIGTQYYYHMEGHFDRKMLMLDHVKTGILKAGKHIK